MSENKEFKPIRAADVKDLLNWDLPQMSGPVSVGLKQKPVDQVTVVEEILAAEKITVAELEEIRENARIEGLAAGLEEGRRKGIDEGREQGQKAGYDAGFAEGLAKGDADLKRVQGLLHQVIQEFENPIQQCANELEECVLGLVVSMAESVIRAELSNRKELLLSSIREALRQIPEPIGKIRIKTNPEDSAYLESLMELPGADPEYIADPQIQVGGYQLETDTTLVKHELEARFKSAIDQLNETFLAGADREDG